VFVSVYLSEIDATRKEETAWSKCPRIYILGNGDVDEYDHERGRIIAG
jgi:hypothetical protein